jgi:peptidoglycan-associated lipoprotein
MVFLIQERRMMMRRNLMFGLVALALCFSLAFLTGCAKKGALKDGAVVTQDQKAVSQAADDAAAREKAQREQAQREQALREQALREQALREQALREQALREQAQREQALRDAAMREAAGKEATEKAKKEAAAKIAAIIKELQIADIHFDYDKYNLKPEAQEILKNGTPAFLKYRDYRLVVEGHCDERGTHEYNLALGEKRATEAANYLSNLGIEKERIKTISYGKEMPLDKGHDEAAWEKNRRAHFVAFPPAK